ncbi:hypothetical protein [Noviherbaspirillum saxi]|uniref:Uncharacterized protein n=1 Tax=Noviherbaspirillum saxi TaxID=2320863 RepID=A0A3A3FN82_9BURK|nr:hypothetical protein [Noviherbaspirillum saxi]RJF97363.1 hypothetical protein D3871_01565 [Noviherbaspirillum saxi]
MTRPETPFEQASYDLNKFRERRMAERRSVPRNSADRRANQNGANTGSKHVDQDVIAKDGGDL